jgi:hypothetical protein
MANTFNLGNGNWAQKTEKLLAYNAENDNYKPLPFDFDRGSTATVVNKDGLIETVGTDEPRIDFLNNTKGHLLLEPSRSNLLTYSEDFSNGAWLKVRSSIVANNVISPDGLQTANKLNDNTDNNSHYIALNNSFSLGSYSASIFAKKGTLDYLYIWFTGFNNVFDEEKVWFNLDSGYVGTTQSPIEASIEDYGNGWYKCTAKSTADVAATGRIAFAISNNDNVSSYSGSGSDNIYLWGAQLEQGSYATSYIPTSGSTATRSAETFNQDGWQSKGILGASTGTLFLDLKDCFSKDNTEIVYQFVDSSDNRVFRLYFEQEGECSVFSIYNNINSEFIKESFTLTSSPKIAIVYDGTTRLDIFGNGEKIVKTGSNLSSNAAIDGFENATSINYNKTSFKEIKLYNTALSDSELQALTS